MIRAALRILPATSWAIVAVCVLMLFGLGWCAVTAPGRERAKLNTAVTAANVRAQATDAKARDLGSDERLADLKTNTQTEKDLTNAVSSLPDARPSDRRVALACQRLRHQGTRPADLPPICRPAG